MGFYEDARQAYEADGSRFTSNMTWKGWGKILDDPSSGIILGSSPDVMRWAEFEDQIDPLSTGDYVDFIKDGYTGIPTNVDLIPIMKLWERGGMTSTLVYHPAGYTGAVQTPVLDGTSLSYTIKAGCKFWFDTNPSQIITLASDITQNITNLTSSNHFIYAYWDGNQVVIAERSNGDTLAQFAREVRLGTITSDPTLPAKGIVRNSSSNPKLLIHSDNLHLRFGGVKHLSTANQELHPLSQYSGSAGLHLSVNANTYQRVGAGFVFGTNYSTGSTDHGYTNDSAIVGASASSKLYVQLRTGEKMATQSGTSAKLLCFGDNTHRYESSAGVLSNVLTTYYAVYYLYYYPVSRLIAVVCDTEQYNSELDATNATVKEKLLFPLQETIYVGKAMCKGNQTAWGNLAYILYS